MNRYIFKDVLDSVWTIPGWSESDAKVGLRDAVRGDRLLSTQILRFVDSCVLVDVITKPLGVK